MKDRTDKQNLLFSKTFVLNPSPCHHILYFILTITLLIYTFTQPPPLSLYYYNYYLTLFPFLLISHSLTDDATNKDKKEGYNHISRPFLLILSSLSSVAHKYIHTYIYSCTVLYKNSQIYGILAVVNPFGR